MKTTTPHDNLTPTMRDMVEQIERSDGDHPTTTMSKPRETASRQSFESWISAPPYEHEVLRYPDDETKHAWPGQYRSIAVQTAWEAWREATESAPRPTDTDLLDWLERNLLELVHERTTCSVDMGGNGVRGWLVNEARGSGAGRGMFCVQHPTIRAAIRDAMKGIK